MPTITKDDIWKATSLLIVPLTGWVWNTNMKITQLELEVKYQKEQMSTLEKKLQSTEEDSKQIVGMKKDIEYIKIMVDNIEKLMR